MPIAAPISYSVKGAQYIAVNAGWGGGLSHSTRAKSPGFPLSKPRLLVFKLEGDAALPALEDAGPPLERPAATGASAEVIAHGKGLYARHCATFMANGRGAGSRICAG